MFDSVIIMIMLYIENECEMVYDVVTVVAADFNWCEFFDAEVNSIRELK